MHNIYEKTISNTNQILENFEEIYQMAMDSGQLNIALKAKELILKNVEQNTEYNIEDSFHKFSFDDLERLESAINQEICNLDDNINSYLMDNNAPEIYTNNIKNPLNPEFPADRDNFKLDSSDQINPYNSTFTCTTQHNIHSNKQSPHHHKFAPNGHNLNFHHITNSPLTCNSQNNFQQHDINHSDKNTNFDQNSNLKICREDCACSSANNSPHAQNALKPGFPVDREDSPTKQISINHWFSADFRNKYNHEYNIYNDFLNFFATVYNTNNIKNSSIPGFPAARGNSRSMTPASNPIFSAYSRSTSKGHARRIHKDIFMSELFRPYNTSKALFSSTWSGVHMIQNLCKKIITAETNKTPTLPQVVPRTL